MHEISERTVIQTLPYIINGTTWNISTRHRLLHLKWAKYLCKVWLLPTVSQCQSANNFIDKVIGCHAAGMNYSVQDNWVTTPLVLDKKLYNKNIRELFSLFLIIFTVNITLKQWAGVLKSFCHTFSILHTADIYFNNCMSMNALILWLRLR